MRATPVTSAGVAGSIVRTARCRQGRPTHSKCSNALVISSFRARYERVTKHTCIISEELHGILAPSFGTPPLAHAKCLFFTRLGGFLPRPKSKPCTTVLKSLSSNCGERGLRAGYKGSVTRQCYEASAWSCRVASRRGSGAVPVGLAVGSRRAVAELWGPLVLTDFLYTCTEAKLLHS